jgi:DNA primase
MSDVQSVLERLNIDVVNSHWNSVTGEELTAFCPYHYDGTAESGKDSWSINAETGKHRCWSCGFAGSLAWLLHKVGDVPLDQAIKEVGGEVDLSIIKNIDPWSGTREIYDPPAPMSRARLLVYDEPPAEALAKRNLTAEAAAAYEVRWETAKSAWVTPIRDALTQEVMGLQIKGPDRYFRNLPGGVNKGSTLFGIEKLPAESVVLVESPLDVLRLYSLGYVGISTFGAAWSAEQMSLIIHNAESVIVAMDNDEAGRTQSLKMLGLNKKGFAGRRLIPFDYHIRMKFFSYDGIDAKDVGDMTDEQIHQGISTARHSVLGKKAILTGETE